MELYLYVNPELGERVYYPLKNFDVEKFYKECFSPRAQIKITYQSNKISNHYYDSLYLIDKVDGRKTQKFRQFFREIYNRYNTYIKLMECDTTKLFIDDDALVWIAYGTYLWSKNPFEKIKFPIYTEEQYQNKIFYKQKRLNRRR